MAVPEAESLYCPFAVPRKASPVQTARTGRSADRFVESPPSTEKQVVQLYRAAENSITCLSLQEEERQLVTSARVVLSPGHLARHPGFSNLSPALH